MTTSNKNNANTFYFLSPGEKISEDKLKQLADINQNRNKKNDFLGYIQNLSQLFGVRKISVTENLKYFIGGFVEGEGSVNASLKRNSRATWGAELDLEFSVTQHVNGINLLITVLTILGTGRIRYKSNSNATMVLIIENRASLMEKVIPFLDKYVVPFASPAKAQRYADFKLLLVMFEEGKHRNYNSFRNEMLPIWHSMRKQQGQVNQAFESLEKAHEELDILYEKRI